MRLACLHHGNVPAVPAEKVRVIRMRDAVAARAAAGRP